MAVISEMQEQEEEEAQTPPSSSSPSVGTYDDVLTPILDRQNPLGFIEIAIDFLRRKSDLFNEEGAEKKIASIVSAAKGKSAEERRKKKADERALEDAGKAEKQLNEADAPTKASTVPLKESKSENSAAAEDKVNGKENVRSEIFYLSLCLTNDILGCRIRASCRLDVRTLGFCFTPLFFGTVLVGIPGNVPVNGL